MVTTDGVAMVTSREYIIAYATTAYNLSGPTKGSRNEIGHVIIGFYSRSPNQRTDHMGTRRTAN